MRILTPSRIHKKGLLSIEEADENAPQEVVFCVPLSRSEASGIETLVDFSRKFSSGISTKIIQDNYKQEIFLDLDYSSDAPNDFRFATRIDGYDIAFYLSNSNFLEKRRGILDISHFYEGSQFRFDLASKRFLILQPDWKQLDRLYMEKGILFSDYV